MKPAFLVVDMQKAFCRGEVEKSMKSTEPYINETAKRFREKSLPVIWIQDLDDSDGVTPGTEGFEIIGDLHVEPGELRIHKRYRNAFNKTNCAGILQEAGVDTVIIAGYCAENCVLSTYQGALNHDLVPVLLTNGVASGDRDKQACVEKISDTISYSVLCKILENVD